MHDSVKLLYVINYQILNFPGYSPTTLNVHACVLEGSIVYKMTIILLSNTTVTAYVVKGLFASLSIIR